jgi:hypothetical protein
MAGGGDVYKVGTPVDNQLGIWTGDGTIEGDPNLTWSGTNLSCDLGDLHFDFGGTNDIALLYNTGSNTNLGLYVNQTSDVYLGRFFDFSIKSGFYGFHLDTYYPKIRMNDINIVEIYNDSSVINNSIISHDTLYLDYLGIGSEGAWLYLTPTHAIDTGTLADVGFGLTMDIPETMTEFMNDNYNDELPYFYKDANGVIQKTYTLTGGWANQAFQKIGSRVEITMRYVRELEKKNNELEFRIERLEKLLLNNENIYPYNGIRFYNDTDSIKIDNINRLLKQSKQETDEILNSY